ncbi:hypothetical protein I308_101445 [Cryptococcus tetragattii IND107]|uniref:Protein BCP1 n=1 Tax=Cryptococcus tetragattii IND107 TaxID=1296105 RepID=A0ABR3C0A4_9TREE|nr:protein BCP1 [Cryptococcus tetragattii IND107]
MPSNPSLEAVSAANATKRKNAPRDDEDSASESGSDVSMINVDFDFYNLNPDVDLIAVKRLLRQTLSYDEERINVHPLAELLLAEGVRLQAGSSIKTDGEESDPWGLVTVIDIVKHMDHPALKPFLEYLCSTLANNSNSPLQSIFNFSSPNIRPALVFSLRMLNLPLPLIPHLYRMLLEELEVKEEGRFTHFIVWGRGYKLEGSEEGMGLDMNIVEKSSKKKKASGNETVALSAGSFPYHPEEEFMDKIANQVHTYNFKTAAPRDAESFGVEQFGRLVLLEKAKLVSAIQSMQAACQ